MAGPTATGPEHSGPVRRIALNVVITEPDPEPGYAGRSLDVAVAASVYAVLQDNGYAVKVELAPEDGPALEDTGQNWQETWPMHARQLDALLKEVATARRLAAVAYAEAYLAAEGTQQARAATAELAAAAARETLETLEGRAEAFRMVLAAEARTDAQGAAPWGDEPRCVYWWHDPANRIHRCELYPGHDGAHRQGSSYAGGGA